MSLYEIYKAKKLGYADDYWTSAIGHSLGGYKWISTDYEQTPYIYRAMPNMSHYYNREIMDAVVGGSVGWNQLCNGSSVTVQNGHKYFLKKGSATSIGASSGSAITGLTSGSDMATDLTLALGSTIADYVYSLEQSTSGSGVAWLKRYFDLDSYHPYDSGSIQSVSGLVSHDVVGFNAWDEEWEVGAIDVTTGANATDPDCIRSKNYIPVVPSSTYYVFKNASLNLGNIRICRYDANKNFIDSPTSLANATIAMTENTHYVRFYARKTSGTATYSSGICINISSDRNGQYEPYVKQSYPLDNTLTLRGVPKLADGKMYYDGDVYESDGSVTRKYGVVDLGTLTYAEGARNTANTGNIFYTSDLSGLIKGGGNLMSAKLVVNPAYNAAWEALGVNEVKMGSLTSKTIVVCLDVTGSAACKTALNGVYLVYELATPTTETAQPFTKTQNCDSGGVEEFVTNGIVSVGHKSKYAEK